MNAYAGGRAVLVRASNPSPMTLEGTNTWVLLDPSASSGRPAVVVDPGPDDEAHREAIMSAVERAGASGVGLVLLTHGHPDHAEGAASFAAAAGAPMRAMAAALCRGGEPLADETVRAGALRIEVVATPGHTADSACFVVAGDDETGGAVLLTGDTVLGRGSTVVARPDGRLADYLDSLRRLRSLVDRRGVRLLLPGHGPVRDDPAEVIEAYLAHRAERLDQLRAAIAAGAASVEEVLAAVYGDVDPVLLAAARWSLLAQLDYLREIGEPAPG